jgi:hypothetical protein
VSNLRIFGIWLAFTAFVVVALLWLSRAGDPPEMMIDAAARPCVIHTLPSPCDGPCKRVPDGKVMT